MKVLKIIASLIIAILLGASTIPVMADGPSPEDPALGINPESVIVTTHTFQIIQNGFQDGPDGILVASPESLVAAGGGCKSYTLGVDGYSRIGRRVWSYARNINWCYNGSTITSLSEYRTVWANYGWGFKSDIAISKSGGVGKTSYWHYAQGDFCFIEFYGCAAHSNPWVNQTVYGNGKYTGSAGGN